MRAAGIDCVCRQENFAAFDAPNHDFPCFLVLSNEQQWLPERTEFEPRRRPRNACVRNLPWEIRLVLGPTYLLARLREGLPKGAIYLSPARSRLRYTFIGLSFSFPHLTGRVGNSHWWSQVALGGRLFFSDRGAEPHPERSAAMEVRSAPPVRELRRCAMVAPRARAAGARPLLPARGPSRGAHEAPDAAPSSPCRAPRRSTRIRTRRLDGRKSRRAWPGISGPSHTAPPGRRSWQRSSWCASVSTRASPNRIAGER